jgi:hypothetical protein
MQPNPNNPDTDIRDEDLDEELAGILTAISIVSKRLARKLLTLRSQDESKEKGGSDDE